MSPFIVELDIVTPVIIREHMMFDGLLAYCKKETGSSIEEALNELPLEQRFSNEGKPYWAASRFFYKHTPAMTGLQRKHTPFEELRDHTDGKRQVSSMKGPDKSYINRLHGSHITKAIAFGVGDIDEVDYLLQKVTHFGGMGRVGFGKVVQAKADDFEFDYSEYIDGALVRPIPTTMADADVVAGALPPYWNKTGWQPIKLPVAQNPKAVENILLKMEGN